MTKSRHKLSPEHLRHVQTH
jgi:carbonic anhydrase